MGTVTITAAGFANLPASSPTGWDLRVTFPANGATNGTKIYTISDADWLKLITWAAAPNGPGGAVGSAGLTPTGAQILLAWVGVWISLTKAGIQTFFTTPPVVPPPISAS